MATQVDVTPTRARPVRLVSVVVPMYDEEAVVEALYDRVRTALEGLEFELVAVDDASTDATGRLLDSLAEADPRVKVLHLTRSFGHQAALTAGLEHASGNVVVMLDGDLQDPPEVIPELLARWADGFDVVSAVRQERLGESRFKLATAKWFYRLFRRVTRLQLLPNAADFRLLDRSALDALLAMPERNRFVRGMTAWIGFRHASVSYRRDPRKAGISKYTVSRMLRFSVDALTSFSWRPLQAATALGFVLIGAALVTGVVAVLDGHELTVVLLAIFLLAGAQLIAVGILGEYVGRIYDEVLRRPLYIVRAARNLDVELGRQDAAHAGVQVPERDFRA